MTPKTSLGIWAFGPMVTRFDGAGAGAFGSVEEAAALARPTATIEPAWDLTEPPARFRALYPALHAGR